jgi:hypothetical protein
MKGRTIPGNDKGNGKGARISALEHGRPEHFIDLVKTVNWRQAAQERMDGGEQLWRRLSFLESGATEEEEEEEEELCVISPYLFMER